VYSQRSIELSLRAIEQLWKKQALEVTQGNQPTLPYREPVYHTVKESLEFVDALNDKLQKAVWEWGEDAAPDYLRFDQEELLWIRNERAVCQADYLYYAERYVLIMGEDRVIHYTPQLSQQIFNYYRSVIEDLGWAIMMQILKARQVGITTDCQAVISHITCFYPDVIAMTGSADKGKTDEMVDKYRLIYEGLPYWLKPSITKDRSGAVLKFGDLNSRLVIQHGRMETGIGRGNTPSAVHLSEICEYPDPATLIDAGLLPAVHEHPRIRFFLESTAAGPFDWWYKKWQWNKANYWEGRAKLCPMFLPWFTRPDIYPTAGWLAQHKVPVDWRPDGVTIWHADRAAKNVREDQFLRKFYPENWKMPREQMWYWELTREEYRAAGKLDIFQREFCSDHMEAFTASGESVFAIQVTSTYLDKLENQKPVGVFAFRDQQGLIPERFHPQPQQIDETQRTLRVGPYELVPVKFDGWDRTEVFDRLLIFEWPEDGAEYGFGVMTGFGIGKDRSALEGMRKLGDCRARQVLELASPYINAQDLAPMIHAVALLYQNAMGKQPRIAIDSSKNGELTQHCLKQFGWGHFHLWLRYDRKKIEPAKSNRLGWFTNAWSRPMLMDMMTWALRGNKIELHSREFIKEMQALHADEDEQEARATEGSFVDRFMALAIIYFSTYILEFRDKHVDTSFLRQNQISTGNSLYLPDRRQAIALPLRPDTVHSSGFFHPNEGRNLLLETHLAVDPGGGFSWEESV
jgi:hypothetical protein